MKSEENNVFKFNCAECGYLLFTCSKHKAFSEKSGKWWDDYLEIPICQNCITHETSVASHAGYFNGYNQAKIDFSAGSAYVQALINQIDVLKRKNKFILESSQKWRVDFEEVITAEVLRREAEAEAKEVLQNSQMEI